MHVSALDLRALLFRELLFRRAQREIQTLFLHGEGRTLGSDDTHRALAGRTRERVELEALLEEGPPPAGGLGQRELRRRNDHGRPICGGRRFPRGRVHVEFGVRRGKRDATGVVLVE